MQPKLAILTASRAAAAPRAAARARRRRRPRAPLVGRPVRALLARCRRRPARRHRAGAPALRARAARARSRADLRPPARGGGAARRRRCSRAGRTSGFVTVHAARAVGPDGRVVVVRAERVPCTVVLRANLAANGVAERVEIVLEGAGRRAPAGRTSIASGETSSLFDAAPDAEHDRGRRRPGRRRGRGRRRRRQARHRGRRTRRVARHGGARPAAPQALFLECNPELLERAGASRGRAAGLARRRTASRSSGSTRADGRLRPLSEPWTRRYVNLGLPARAVKPAGYFAQDRAELVRLLPRPLGRVLDVGCGEGRTGRSLRAAGRELDLRGRARSGGGRGRGRAAYDEVRVGPVEAELGALDGPFDTILLYDVLEHLVDPWELLRRLHGVAAPGARVHVSVPNARHWTLLRDLGAARDVRLHARRSTATSRICAGSRGATSSSCSRRPAGGSTAARSARCGRSRASRRRLTPRPEPGVPRVSAVCARAPSVKCAGSPPAKRQPELRRLAARARSPKPTRGELERGAAARSAQAERARAEPSRARGRPRAAAAGARRARASRAPRSSARRERPPGRDAVLRQHVAAPERLQPPRRRRRRADRLPVLVERARARARARTASPPRGSAARGRRPPSRRTAPRRSRRAPGTPAAGRRPRRRTGRPGRRRVRSSATGRFQR